MTIKVVSVTLLLFAALLPAAAQQKSANLTMDEAVAAVLRNNGELQAAAIDEKIAEEKFRQTNAIFLPQAEVTYTAITTNNPLNAFGFKLQQKIITQNDFDPALLNHPSATNDFSAKFEVRQPLLNTDMIYLRKAARTATEAEGLKKRRTAEYLEFQVKNAYYQLQLAYRVKEVADEALVTVNAIYTFTNNRVKQGLLQKSDLLNVQVKVAEAKSAVESAKSAVQNASDYIGFLMNSSPGTIYITGDLQQIVPPANPTGLTLSPGRADYQALQKAIEATDQSISASRSAYLPKLNAFGSWQLNDNKLSGSYTDSYLAGIQLSWNIFNGTRTRHQISQQKLEKDRLSVQLKNQVDQGEIELKRAERSLSDAQYKISQQQTAVEQAAEALRILKNRHEQGLTNTTDLLMAQSQLSQQKMLLAEAIVQNNVTVEQIRFLTADTGRHITQPDNHAK